MSRDQQKEVSYFSAQIDFINGAAAKRFLDTESFPNISGRPGLVHDLAYYVLQITILRYSRGDTLETIRPALWQWVEAKEIQQRAHAGLPSELANIRQMYEKVTLDTVYDALTMLAFAAALPFKNEEMTRLIRAIGHAGEDALIDLAAHALGDAGRTVSPTCKYPKVYQPLLEVWQAEPAQRPALLQAYAKDWKRKIKPIYWSNSLNGAEGAYFGYWAFDIALTVMLLDIDDQGLLTNPYYPKDLVQHYRA
ncbi:DUF1911 domain-containing protein [Azoarcus sp. L1K30]|uniref:PoNe immunity protein domain-containing protein n=1 Tax=Azoarcus sp. L1K30 TaxID=2820277 RepID=UPI001B81ADB2|nr:PoNe immunity protein domain-containing protein [Azoarcus sp. L1K30]MBR0565978.1 DUF1911 domain-containing protein [Azoarcus sp. L1K30]